ncbi:isoprenylcysteine carboxylmethyltransferase family protein [Chitinophaga sp. Mgbs1]|uniref:Isoprenylcysteine carboxylmethyltransferase family protein n=1 Tax=Chitinophaga solisilvae TaxID=1233460 RepID=A0A9Q5DC71_9BACT|nr:isoprenylcysteine carboxylmethyltransferase family protein [Chitinophaga solisilvae]
MNKQQLRSLALRNLLFTMLQPGMVAGVIPWLLAKQHFRHAFASFGGFRQYAGAVIWLTGLAILLHCITRFALDGMGTLSPADPTRKLVISGLYRYSRNPMYVGVMLLLTGEALFCNAAILWQYSMLLLIIFHLFIIFYEEPRLRRDFGETYVRYSQQVRRWV